MASSPWVEGWRAPVRREMVSDQFSVTGSLPRELNGQLLRIGPNPVRDPGPDYHWFSGEGMVHSIRLEDGRAVEYRNRWVRTPDTCRRLGERCGAPRLDALDVANTNVVGFAGELYALTETCAPYRLTPGLITLGREDFGDEAAENFTAHPHVDPVSGELHAIGYTIDDQPWLDYFVIGTDARLHTRIEIPLGGPAAAHDFGLTQTHVLFFDLPVLYNRELDERGMVIPYRWDADYRARVGVLPRNPGAGGVRWFDVPPCWVFHTMNAYDVHGPDGAVSSIVWDVVRFERMLDSDITGPNEPYPPQLYRWELDLKSGRVAETLIDARVQEFPRIDERRWSQPYRYGFTTEVLTASGGTGLLMHDTKGGSTSFELEPGFQMSEAVFAPRAPDAAEGDGWLLAVVHDDARASSELIVLEAMDVASGPIARVGLPQRVPAGFHGNWIPD